MRRTRTGECADDHRRREAASALNRLRYAQNVPGTERAVMSWKIRIPSRRLAARPQRS